MKWIQQNLGVMYKTWQHNFKYGIQKFMTKAASNGGKKYLFNLIARSLGGVPLVLWKDMHEDKVANTSVLLKKLRSSTGKTVIQKHKFYLLKH